MEKDIILQALLRLREIVSDGQSSYGRPNASIESDQRLARLAIKKYLKTQLWRRNVQGRHDGERRLWI